MTNPCGGGGGGGSPLYPQLLIEHRFYHYILVDVDAEGGLKEFVVRKNVARDRRAGRQSAPAAVEPIENYPLVPESLHSGGSLSALPDDESSVKQR